MWWLYIFLYIRATSRRMLNGASNTVLTLGCNVQPRISLVSRVVSRSVNDVVDGYLRISQSHLNQSYVSLNSTNTSTEWGSPTLFERPAAVSDMVVTDLAIISGSRSPLINASGSLGLENISKPPFNMTIDAR